MQFQWYFNGTSLVGQTNNWLLLTSIQASQGGAYQLVATNNFGSVTGLAAVVWTPPDIVMPPSATVVFNSNATFNLAISGTPPFGYQWLFNGTPLTDNGHISGSTATNLSISNFQPADLGNYTVIVTNLAGSTTSLVATVTVLNPLVTTQPQSQSALGGDTVTFGVTATGQQPLAYQWQFNGTNLDWGTNNPLVLTNVLVSQSGLYSLVVTNGYGAAFSSNAILNVIPLRINTQPQNQSVLGGANVPFSVNVSGQQPLVFRWQFNGANLDWGTNNPLVLTNVLVSQAGTYSVVVSNNYGMAASSNATLNVAALAITTQPTNRVAWQGGSAFFKANVSGQAPFGFDWQYNGADIPVTASNLLTLTNLQASQFGPYDVVVSNSYGSVTSSIANLLFSQVALWGYSLNGETNLPAGLTNIIAISCGTPGPIDCLALKSNGTIIEWPGSPSSYVIEEVTNLLAIACAGAEGPNLGLKSDGTVISWVYDPPLPVYGLTNIAAIVPRYSGYLALKTNGTLADVGLAGAPPPIVTNLTSVVAISQGYQHSIALQADGIVSAWGINTYGQTNIPAGLSNVVAIAAGGFHNLALMSDSTVVAWGRNIEHQTNVPAGLSNVVAIAAGGYHSLALKSDGTVVAWGMNVYGQTNTPPGLTNVNAIAAGEYDSLALIGNGPPATQALLTNPNLGVNGFNLSLPTRSGKVYVLQYENSLSDSNWTSLPLVPGNGNTTLLTDPTATNSQRFYRVQQW